MFEFGIAYRSVVSRGHVRVLAKIAEVVEAGVTVCFVAGNHDHLEWGWHVVEEDAGVTLLPDPSVMEIAGRRTLITHGGDGAARERVERRLARSRPFVAFLRLLHPDWVARIQPYTTTTRRQVNMHGAGEGGGQRRARPR